MRLLDHVVFGTGRASRTDKLVQLEEIQVLGLVERRRCGDLHNDAADQVPSFAVGLKHVQDLRKTKEVFMRDLAWPLKQTSLPKKKILPGRPDTTESPDPVNEVVTLTCLMVEGRLTCSD